MNYEATIPETVAGIFLEVVNRMKGTIEGIAIRESRYLMLSGSILASTLIRLDGRFADLDGIGAEVKLAPGRYRPT